MTPRRLLSVLLTSLLLSACSGGGGDGESPRVPTPPIVASITVFPSTASIQVGATQQYTTVIKDTNANIMSGIAVAWSTGDPAVATIDGGGLATGLQTGTTTILATSGTITGQLVMLTVTAAVVPPAIGTSPTSLSFTAQQGGGNPNAQTLTISNTGGGTLTWTASENAPWLTLTPASGSGNGAIDLTVTTGILAAGIYNGAITIGATGTAPVTVPVTFTVTPAPVPPAIGVSPTSLSFTAQQGGGNPAAQTLNISNTGGGTLNWSVIDNANWASSSPTSGTGNGPVTISVTTGTLTAGSYSGTITVSGAGTASVTIPVTLTVTGTTALAPLPPWLTYCNNPVCAALPPVVAAVCPSGTPSCAPTRATTVLPQVDGVQVSAIALPLIHDTTLNGIGLPNTTVWLISGNGVVFNGAPLFVDAFTTSSVQLQSDQDLLLSYYGVTPLWGSVTPVNFATTHLTSALLDMVFYQFPTYRPDTSVADLDAQSQTIIATEQRITGITTSEHVTAYFLPTELAAAQQNGEGNFSFGNGTITINYGHPLYIMQIGGILTVALPEVAHEYAHELFDEVKGAFLDNFSCLNEGQANALGLTAGFVPEAKLGPIGLRGVDFRGGCLANTEIHDIGDCYFWHVKNAGLLTSAFMFGIYHPQHNFTFNSCVMNLETGNSLLVYFTESANDANLLPVLDAMKLPHAASYADAKKALGL